MERKESLEKAENDLRGIIVRTHRHCQTYRVRIRMKGGQCFELNASELDDLIGCIAREANETKDRWLENELQEVFDRLEGVQYWLRSTKV